MARKIGIAPGQQLGVIGRGIWLRWPEAGQKSPPSRAGFAGCTPSGGELYLTPRGLDRSLYPCNQPIHGRDIFGVLREGQANAPAFN